MNDVINLQRTLYTSKNPTRRWLHCARRDWVLKKIYDYGGNKQIKSLVVGPGAGVYIAELAEISSEVVVSDIEQAFLDYIKSQKLNRVICVLDDITKTKLNRTYFDLILCTEVIEHIAESIVAIKNMRALLKPGGHLILTTPQKYSPLEIFSKFAYLPGVIQFVRLISRKHYQCRTY